MLDPALRTMDRGQREKLLIQATDIEVRDHATVPLHHQFNIEAMTPASTTRRAPTATCWPRTSRRRNDGDARA